jgi:hypothetical protein
MRYATVAELLQDERQAVVSTGVDMQAGGFSSSVVVDSLLRLSVCWAGAQVVISSMQTETTLSLPVEDVPLLIETLRNLGRTESVPETIDLDPSS